jgi:hypothetical protein
MPRELTVAQGADVTKRWTITSYSVLAPALPPPQDGSASLQFTIETLIGGVVQVTERGSSAVSAAKFYALWADVGARLQTMVTGGADFATAYHDATRDAMYAQLQADGIIPAEAE